MCGVAEGQMETASGRGNLLPQYRAWWATAFIYFMQIDPGFKQTWQQGCEVPSVWKCWAFFCPAFRRLCSVLHSAQSHRGLYCKGILEQKYQVCSSVRTTLCLPPAFCYNLENHHLLEHKFSAEVFWLQNSCSRLDPFITFISLFHYINWQLNTC